MEYIREMLLRQRTALARLMLGGVAEETSETASAPAADRREAAVPMDRGTGPSEMAAGGREARRSGQQSAAAAHTSGEFAWQGETLRQALARKSAAGRQAAGIPGVAGTRDTSVRSAGRRAAGAGGLAGSGFNPPADAGRAPGGRLSAWESLPAAGGEAAGAKALSRAFQQDARRYDGGFRLYD